MRGVLDIEDNSANSWIAISKNYGVVMRESFAIGTYNQSASETLNVGKDISLDVTKIQEMIRGLFTNNGFVLRVATENNDAYQWASSDHATAAYRPKLVIEYTLPSGNHFWWG